MEICNFYIFGSKSSEATVQAHSIGLNPTPDPSAIRFSDHNRLLVGDYEHLKFPIIFKHEYGSKWEDILGTGWINLYLICDKLKAALEENQLTGWKTYPIKLLDKKDNEVSGYHGFSITGRCGPVDYSKSTIIQKSLYENGPVKKYYKGWHVGLDKWDGSDFFIPEKTLGIVITKKTAEIIKKQKFTNISLTNLADDETEESIVKM